VVTVQTNPHTLAVIDALKTIGKPVGDARKPDGEPPYAVVYPFGGTRSGPVGDPDADASLTWQITCVGRDREGAEWMADRVAEVMDGGVVNIPGRKVMRAQTVSDQPIRRDDDVQPPLFYATPIWRLDTTPA
jgi:hypothetical protein